MELPSGAQDQRRGSDVTVPLPPRPASTTESPERQASPAVSATVREEPAPERLNRGDLVGRYVVLERLGEGGMGVVYSAYDPELDRRLAIKVVRPSAAGAGMEQARLLREAQALGRLKHPNVIAVHDVGALGDQVFIAMELVEGRTLAAWLKEQHRGWREILSVMAAAGRGLAAAHEGGLVHRDFKPGNVMVDERGRVFVVDFGLARRAETDSQAPAGAPAADPSGDQAMTSSLGTPRYMSPEQHAMVRTDARSDQFSFCVTLYEALYREGPFATAPTVAPTEPGKGGQIAPHWRLREAPRAGRTAKWFLGVLKRGLRPHPEDPPPTRVRRALTRGLSPRPEDRFASMDELLVALSPARLRRRIVAVAVIGAAAAVALAAGALGRESARAPVCKAGAGRAATLWNDSSRQAISAAFLATKSPIAAETWQRVSPALADYASRWAAMHDEACAATRVHGDQSAALLDLRMQCLDTRFGDLAALLDIFRAADVDTVARSVEAASSLPALAPCADRARLLMAMPPPEDPIAARLVERAREKLSRVRGLLQSGHWTEAQQLAEEAVKSARAAHHPPAEAETLFELGVAQYRLGKNQAADATLRSAAFSAVAGRNDEVAAQAELMIVRMLGDDEKKDEAQKLALFAQAEVLRAGNHPLLRAELLSARARSEPRDKALEDDLAALQLRQKELGPDHVSLAYNLDSLYTDYGNNAAEALPYARKAYALNDRALGPDHPHTLASGAVLANALRAVGEFPEARVVAERSLLGQVKTLGPTHPLLGVTYGTLAVVAMMQGRTEEALAAFDRQLELVEQHSRKGHPGLIFAELGRSLALGFAGRLTEALAAIERGRAVAEQNKMMGPDSDVPGFFHASEGLVEAEGRHSERAFAAYGRALASLEGKSSATDFLVLALDGLGRLLLERGETTKALAAHERALALSEKESGQDNALTCPSRLGVAQAALALGDVKRAGAQAERLIAIGEAKGIDPAILGAARFVLARVVLRADRPRAIALARRALQATAQRSPLQRSIRAQIQRWLAAN